MDTMETKGQSLSRSENLKKMLKEAENIPGLVELMTVYGSLDELLLKTQEYLGAYNMAQQPTLSDTSS